MFVLGLISMVNVMRTELDLSIDDGAVADYWRINTVPITRNTPTDLNNITKSQLESCCWTLSSSIKSLVTFQSL